MNTEQINNILWRCPETRKFYVGCYPCDGIPPVRCYPCSMVLNLEPMKFCGSHWVAIFLKKFDHAYYFDSLGNPPNVCIVKHLKFCNINNITHNMVPFQHIFSVNCGLYCIAFLHYMSQNYFMDHSFYNFLKYFCKDKLYNDHFVYMYVNSLIKV